MIVGIPVLLVILGHLQPLRPTSVNCHSVVSRFLLMAKSSNPWIANKNSACHTNYKPLKREWIHTIMELVCEVGILIFLCLIDVASPGWSHNDEPSWDTYQRPQLTSKLLGIPLPVAVRSSIFRRRLVVTQGTLVHYEASCNHHLTMISSPTNIEPATNPVLAINSF